MAEQQRFVLGPDGLGRFLALRQEAVEAVSARFYQSYPQVYSAFAEDGREACREDIAYHLQFLRPVLELGVLQPFADYLRWLLRVLGTRSVPTDHLPLALDWLAEFFSTRLPGPDAAAVSGALGAAKMTLLAEAEHSTLYAKGVPDAWAECTALEQALVGGDQRRAIEIFQDTARSNRNFLETALHVLQPALYRIGVRWQENQVSVGQEHLATAIAYSILTRAFADAQPAPPNGRKAVLACVEGNEHVMGLRLVSDALELAGWQIRYLGANMPNRALVELVREDRPHLVGLSVSLPQQFSAARKCLSRLREALGGECPTLMLGGLAINQFQPMATMLGADLTSADAKSAAEAAGRLTQGP